MSSTAYLKLRETKSPHFELCQAAPLHSHPMATGRPVYFSDLTVHVDNKWVTVVASERIHVERVNSLEPARLKSDSRSFSCQLGSGLLRGGVKANHLIGVHYNMYLWQK